MLQSLKESVDLRYRVITNSDNRGLLSLKIVSVGPDFAHASVSDHVQRRGTKRLLSRFDKLVVDEYEES